MSNPKPATGARDPRPTKVGIATRCDKCVRIKKPHGRSAPMGSDYCDRDCSGYDLDPLPGCLWPGETDADFGYPCCDLSTKPITEERPHAAE